MMGEFIVDVSGEKLTENQQRLLERDAQSMMRTFGSHLQNARLNLYVKALRAKKLVHVHAKLVTDKGRYFTSKEGWRVGHTCMSAIEGLRAQLQRQFI